MNKIQLIIFTFIALIFIGIVYIVQSNIKRESLKESGSELFPTSADDTNKLGLFATVPPQQQVQRPQQQQQQQMQQVNYPTPEVYGVEEEFKATYSATIKTSKGDIKIKLYGDKTPNTVKNFLNKIKSSFYKNLTFHRVEDWVIQGGDPKGNGTGGGQITTEFTDLPFVTGSIGMARGSNKEISNDSQFFILKQDAPWLNNNYTNFGIVTNGMNVVKKIERGDLILDITIDNLK